MSESGIILQNIDFSYPADAGRGTDQPVGDEILYHDFTLEFPASRVSVILGPSGCGKTTLLNLICGLLQPQSGKILCGDGSGGPENMSLLFQEPRLLPWRTIRRNIEIVLDSRLGEKSRETAERYLKLVGLEEYGDYFPEALSGGMRQRVAIARAFAYPAETILMDEPFQALDLGLKMNLTRLFSELWIRDRRTSIFVTHDINEAILLGDEIFVLSADKPVSVVDHIKNPVPHNQRRLDQPECLNIEAKLYRLLAAGGNIPEDM